MIQNENVIDAVFEELEDPVIEVGDKVIFECSNNFTGQPRWMLNDDTGATDMWANGVVTYVDEKIIQVKYTVDGLIGTGNATWPNIDHPDYDPMQWWQDGYLSVLPRPICECGSEKLFGKMTGHSWWCPKYKGD